MSRHAMVEDKVFVVKRLNELRRGRKMTASYHVQRVFEMKGLVKATYEKKEKGRGRTSKVYVLTGRGSRILEKARAEQALAAEARAARKIAKEEAATRH